MILIIVCIVGWRKYLGKKHLTYEEFAQQTNILLSNHQHSETSKACRIYNKSRTLIEEEAIHVRFKDYMPNKKLS